MKTFSIHLSHWRNDAIPQAKPFLDCYLQEPAGNGWFPHKRPAVIVLPGSGYWQNCPREGEPIAMEFARLGLQVFVCYYRCQTPFPGPLLDAAEALATVRSHAKEWWIDPDKILILGFSAGGHLAASLSCLWNDPVLPANGISNDSARPNGTILCYPVITSEPGKCHEGSFDNLLFEKKDELRESLSLEKRVTELNPPTFLWHTATDESVPFISSLRYALALQEHGVSVELHVFPRGPHGASLARKQTACGNPAVIIPEAAQWIDLCADWVKRNFFNKEADLC